MPSSLANSGMPCNMKHPCKTFPSIGGRLCKSHYWLSSPSRGNATSIQGQPGSHIDMGLCCGKVPSTVSLISYCICLKFVLLPQQGKGGRWKPAPRQASVCVGCPQVRNLLVFDGRCPSLHPQGLTLCAAKSSFPRIARLCTFMRYRKRKV